MRTFQTVKRQEWVVAGVSRERIRSLLEAHDPVQFLDEIVRSAVEQAGQIRMIWQLSEEKPGFARVEFIISLDAELFDKFFNGRCGYRAQFYLSPEEGILYNRLLLDRLLQSLAATQISTSKDWTAYSHSLAAPHAKVWLGGEQAEFNDSEADVLAPPRWQGCAVGRGRKAPRPSAPLLDVKGGFVGEDGSFFVDPYKLDRAWDIHCKGYT